jgi:hypothetical protein
MKTTLCILALTLTLSSTSALAAPGNDTPRGPVDRIIQRIGRAVKHFLHPTPEDEIQVPLPK